MQSIGIISEGVTGEVAERRNVRDLSQIRHTDTHAPSTYNILVVGDAPD